MYRIFPLLLLSLHCFSARAQKDEWIAPEGKIINYRTLLPSDYLGKPEKGNDHYSSYIVPALYYTADNPKTLDNGRLTWDFTVKCAFQSKSWVKQETEEGFRHQQNNYDISLTFSNLLKMQLYGRDFSPTDYNKELHAIQDNLWQKEQKVDEAYRQETELGMKPENELLWDMRVKKCLENNTDEFFYSPTSAVISVRGPGQLVKRLPDEPKLVFATRCRPLHTWFTDEMGSKTIETTEWTNGKEVIAFYQQNYKTGASDLGTKESSRILACAFLPTGKDTYKRVSIDSFSNEDKQVKITAVFYANADSDGAKELFILTSEPVRNNISAGTLYTTHVYDNVSSHGFPPRLQKLDDIARKVDGGIEGTQNGKPSHPKCRNEKEVREALKKLGLG